MIDERAESLLSAINDFQRFLNPYLGSHTLWLFFFLL